eukprot:2235022-Prymnesium_polylepis.3
MASGHAGRTPGRTLPSRWAKPCIRQRCSGRRLSGRRLNPSTAHYILGMRLCGAGMQAGVEIGTFRARSLEASGTLGRRKSGASSGLYCAGNTLVGRRPVSSHISEAALCEAATRQGQVEGEGAAGSGGGAAVTAAARGGKTNESEEGK